MQYNVLSQICVRGKVKQAASFIDDLIAQGHKTVVFVWHIESIRLLKKYMSNDPLTIYGNMKSEECQRTVDSFQRNPEKKCIIITYMKGGTGYTLTAADTWVALETGWTPKDQDQAEDRIHRIGQKNKVNCYYLVAQGTVDEKKAQIIEDKRQIFKNAVDSKDSTETVLSELIAHTITPKKAATQKQASILL